MRRIAMIAAWLLAVGCGGSEFGTDGVGSDAAVGGAAGTAAGAAGSQPYDGGAGAADAFTGGSGGAAGQSDAATPDGSAGVAGGTAGEAGAGGAADAQPTCSQDEHFCGSQCVENTPDNGCGVQCSPCASPDNAHAVCGSQGECSWECDAGCEETATGCVCPVHECCDHAECAGSSCWSGICQVGAACHLEECRSWCVFCMGKPDGFCNSGGGCQCED